MKLIDKTAVINFGKPGNDEASDLCIDRISSAALNAVSDMAKINPLIDFDSVSLSLVNEYTTGAYNPTSEIDIFLSLTSAQMEYNSQKQAKSYYKRLLDKFKYAWNHRKVKKRKSKKKIDPQEDYQKLISESKYTINSFKSDLQGYLIKYLTNTSIVYNQPSRLKVIGKEEFGIKINIYPVLKVNEVYKYYDALSRKFIKVDFNKRNYNIEEKIERVGERYIDIIRIFNAVYFNLSGMHLNQIFIESLLYNCPDELFQNEDIYEAFLNIVNYLRFTSLSSFKSICDESVLLFKDKLSGFSLQSAQKLIRDISNSLQIDLI